MPEPRKPYPGRPTTQTASTLHFYKEDLAHYSDVAVAITQLRTKILVAVGPIINAELSADAEGLAAKTLAQILQHIDTHYGTLDEEDIKKLRNQIANFEFRSPANFAEDAANFHLLVATMDKGGEPMTQTNLMEIFTENTKRVIGIPEIIARYKRNVELDKRNVKEMTEKVRQDLKVITTSDGKYASNCETNVAEEELVHQVLANCNANAQSNAAHFVDALKKIGERLDYMDSRSQGNPNPDRGGGNNNKRGGRGTPGRGGASSSAGGRGAGPGPGKATHTSLYCFEHGTNRSHKGVDCKIMEKDASYTQEMKNATKSCTINGWVGAK